MPKITNDSKYPLVSELQDDDQLITLQGGRVKKAPFSHVRSGVLEKAALAAIDRIVQATAAVDVFIYDTRRDSDGGAWRKRCSHLSWYKEPLNTSTRGKTREFPEVALIVAETAKVTIYDLTDSSVPMWMVFEGGFLGSAVFSSVAMKNGLFQAGCTTARGLVFVDFVVDRLGDYVTTGRRTTALTVAQRDGSFSPWITDATLGIVSSVINDAAITVLPDAPIDAATGLPVPTIAVATDGGVSVINGPAGVGTVVDLTHTVSTNNASGHVVFGDDGSIGWSSRSATGYVYFQVKNSIPDADDNTAPDRAYYPHTGAAGADLVFRGANTQITAAVKEALGTGGGLNILQENASASADGMVAYCTKSYNSGWLPGDIRGAWLADTVAETVGRGVELLTNGKFDADLSGWSTVVGTAGGTATWNSGRIQLTQGSSSRWLYAYQAFSTEVGKTYRVAYELVSRSAAPPQKVILGTTAPPSDGSIYPSGSTVKEVSVGVGSGVLYFKATGTTTYFIITDGQAAGANSVWDNFSCAESEQLVVNGTFGTDINSWTLDPKAGGGSIAWNAGTLKFTQGASSAWMLASQPITTIPGKTYILRYECLSISSGGNGYVIVSNGSTPSPAPPSTNLASSGNLGTPKSYSLTFVAQSTATTIAVYDGQTTFATSTWDNISIRLAAADRSVKNTAIAVHGTLTKTAVATGADLIAYSGFSADNYLEQPYNSDLDFGTGDFCVMGWWRQSANSNQETLFSRETSIADRIRLLKQSTDYLRLEVLGTTVDSGILVDATWYHVAALRRSGTLYLHINGESVGTPAAQAGSVSSASALLRLGILFDGTAPLTSGSLALWRASAYAPTAEQIRHIYETERRLFEENAACTLAGDSDAILAMDYDEDTGLYHCMTSYGRSTFQGLERIDSEATGVGTPTAVAARGGKIAHGGSSGVDAFVPARNLREEVERQVQLNIEDHFQQFRFAFGAADTDAELPAGIRPWAVYHAGLLVLEGTTDDYQIIFDGFIRTVRFNAAPGAGTVVVFGRRIS